MKSHIYKIQTEWTGNLGNGTNSYTSYSRNHSLHTALKPTILLSSDPAFRGDLTRYNPEELLVASLSSCFMLWYLHLCSKHQVTVVTYIDNAEGTMVEENDGSGCFKEVILKPAVTVLYKLMVQEGESLFDKAHKLCFIANSVNFSVRHEYSINFKE